MWGTPKCSGTWSVVCHGSPRPPYGAQDSLHRVLLRGLCGAGLARVSFMQCTHQICLLSPVSLNGFLKVSLKQIGRIPPHSSCPCWVMSLKCHSWLIGAPTESSPLCVCDLNIHRESEMSSHGDPNTAMQVAADASFLAHSFHWGQQPCLWSPTFRMQRRGALCWLPLKMIKIVKIEKIVPDSL